jgi:hypothetical protein
MEWEKKKRLIWALFAIASVMSLAGIFLYAAFETGGFMIISVVGMAMLGGIMWFCMTDR